MAVYLVTWDLNKERQNYTVVRDQFLARLNRYENIKDPGLDSVCFVSSNLTSYQISDDLRLAMDQNDRIIVTRLISGNYQGWLGENIWIWINQRL